MKIATMNPGFRRTFPALYHRNFRLFWCGQCVSLIGTWMQNIGQAWLVLKLTGSPMKLGMVTAVQYLPVMLLSFAAGPFVDRYPKRRMLLATQTALMILAFALALLAWTGTVRYWNVLVLALLLGLVNTLDVPTRQSFFIELVGRDDLMNAISLNSTVFNIARIVGPAVAGLMIGAIGIAPCFLINGISFLAVLWALSRIEMPSGVVTRRPESSSDGLGRSILEGVHYILERPVILWPIVLVAMMSTFVINFSIVIPIFAQRELAGDAKEFGFLMTAMGIGSLVGALALTARSAAGPKISKLLLGAFGMSVFSMAVGFQHNFYVSCVLLAFTGFCTITCTAQINATIQINSEDRMRGRVMSVYALAFGGVTPIGSLYAGRLMDSHGASACLVVSGLVGIVSAATCAFMVMRSRRAVR
jgi:MFS family permease